MQEIKKRRILLASVLKPADEPRMFERMGQSLAANGYEVFIAGFPSSMGKSLSAIHLLPHKKFKRISLARIKVRFKILKEAFSIRPEVFIISTHELIGVAILYRIFSGRKIVYDVQEDYWKNIMYTRAWPIVIRPLIAYMVRLKETVTSPFFSKFLLAERCYENELLFTKRKSLIVENKCRVPDNFFRQPSSNNVKLIFTGTIAESTGVSQAIELTKKLHAVDPRIQLQIIGHFPQPRYFQKIESEIAAYSFISLVGGDFVSHEKIMEAIGSAHFGIVFYPSSPHTKNKIPSKLYEYLTCQLPILLQDNKVWVNLCQPFNSAIVIDFARIDPSSTLKQMREKNFYSRKAENVDWQSEEGKFLSAIDSIT
ncbi:MAG: hypothetical protein HY015_05415 [Bacteroidetes bacterium]|nr:hypothetical protein [Bacteroidota bacterium]MBI3482399.1 hypothetical protein [Bacteroidota bacterium]